MILNVLLKDTQYSETTLVVFSFLPLWSYFYKILHSEQACEVITMQSLSSENVGRSVVKTTGISHRKPDTFLDTHSVPSENASLIGWPSGNGRWKRSCNRTWSGWWRCTGKFGRFHLDVCKLNIKESPILGFGHSREHSVQELVLICQVNLIQFYRPILLWSPKKQKWLILIFRLTHELQGGRTIWNRCGRKLIFKRTVP